jgi:hypothetical protein
MLGHKDTQLQAKASFMLNAEGFTLNPPSRIQLSCLLAQEATVFKGIETP